MRRSLLIPRALSVLIGASLVASSPGVARADQTDVCIDASVRGQELRDQGKLVAARAALLACGERACPRLLQAECAGWLADVDARTPSVVVGAVDEGGHDTADVVVTLDGAPFLARLDGQARALDPGAHVLRFERKGLPFVEQKVILREGERRRVITVSFAPAAAALGRGDAPAVAASPAGPGRVIAVVALGGVAVASGLTLAVLGLGAKNDAADLRATCAPTCSVAAVDAVRREQIGANVALGIGALAASAAAILVFTWPAPAALTPSVALRPMRGGAIAGFVLPF
jgi:hypothetical protein